MSWWQAEGNGNDSVGPDSVTLSPGGATYAPGMVGQAFNFEGASGCAEKTNPDGSLMHDDEQQLAIAWCWTAAKQYKVGEMDFKAQMTQ